MATVTLNGTEEKLAERTAANPSAADAASTPPAASGTTLPIEFKFDQRELQALVNLTDQNYISVATWQLTHANGEKELYLCALSNKAQATPTSLPETDTTMRPIIGCPFPPEWKDELTFLSHDDVAARPKYFLNASLLKNELHKNEHAASNGDKMVSATLSALINIDTNQSETVVTFTMKGQGGTTIIHAPLVAKSTI
jgi:hypothetical protein